MYQSSGLSPILVFGKRRRKEKKKKSKQLSLGIPELIQGLMPNNFVQFPLNYILNLHKEIRLEYAALRQKV